MKHRPSFALALMLVSSAAAAQSGITSGYGAIADIGFFDSCATICLRPGGLDEAVEPDLARAVRERNRLLLRWKHLSTRAEATEHLVSLWRTVLEAGLAGDRRTLEEVCLADARQGAVTGNREKK